MSLTFEKSLIRSRVVLAAFGFAGLLAWAQPAAAEQCVSYVQRVSSVHVSGNAGDWWDNAAGVYPRDNQPAPGSVMVFEPTHRMPSGHVALVRRIIDDRSVLVDHANWASDRKHKGRVALAQLVVDTSPDNDWSRVRVSYPWTGGLGVTDYPLAGFIHPANGGFSPAAPEGATKVAYTKRRRSPVIRGRSASRITNRVR